MDPMYEELLSLAGDDEALREHILRAEKSYRLWRAQQLINNGLADEQQAKEMVGITDTGKEENADEVTGSDCKA